MAAGERESHIAAVRAADHAGALDVDAVVLRQHLRHRVDVVETVVRDLLWPVVEGKDPRDVSGLHDAMFATLRPWGHYRGFVQEGMSGIDQALWDIVAQAQGVPLYKALHGAARATVPVYGSKVYTTDIPAMAKEARGAVDRGHKAIKV